MCGRIGEGQNSLSVSCVEVQARHLPLLYDADADDAADGVVVADVNGQQRQMRTVAVAVGGIEPFVSAGVATEVDDYDRGLIHQRECQEQQQQLEACFLWMRWAVRMKKWA